MIELAPVHWFILSLLAFFTILAVLMYFVFRAKDNPIFCWQLIASRNTAGEERADLDKVGKAVALFVSTLIVLYCVMTNKGLDMTLIGLITLWLTYAGGIATFSAYMRMRQDTANKDNR